MQLACGKYGTALAAVCAEGSIANIRVLLDAGALINMPIMSGLYGNALAAACHQSNTPVVEFLVNQGADVNMQLSRGLCRSALAAACAAGSVEKIHVLLDAGASINMPITSGRYGNALTAACYRSSTTVVEFLVRQGADVNMQLSSGIYGSALVAASIAGSVEKIRVLLDAGASINIPVTSRSYGNALVAACHRSSTTVVSFLVSQGADVNLVLENGEFPTALTAAIRGRNSEIVQTLLIMGADPNVQLPTGGFGDAVSLAIHLREKVSIDTLIQAGAHIGPLASDLIHTLSSLSNYNDLHIETHADSCYISSIVFDCELPEMAKNYHDLSSWLPNMRVLVRKETVIEYSSVDQFLCKTYGLKARHFLGNLVRSFGSNPSSYGESIANYSSSTCLFLFLVDGTMSFSIRNSSITLECCSLDKELPSMFEWLCYVIRQRVPGITYLPTADNKYTNGSLRLSLQPIQTLHVRDSSNYCWTELFEGVAIALGPGVQTPEPSRGLEMDCNTMIQLAVVEYPVLIDSDTGSPPGLVFLGYSTALIPIRETEDNMILWHLEVASNDRQIKASELQATQSEWLRTTDLSYLLSKKALLGWCSQAELRLGARTDDLNVTWSQAKVKPFSFELSGINLQALAQSAAPAQFGIQAGASWKLVNNTIRFTQADEYLRCLNNSREQQIVLYDVSTSRAWLVPLISVFHHMLLVYWKRIPEKFRENDIPLADPTPLNMDASYEALVDKGELIIQRSDQIEHSLTIRKLIIGFAINLGRISLKKPKGNKIYGYEFMDIACETQTTTLKKTTLERDGLAWLPLLKEIDCLFCSDLGDAIVGQRTSETLSPCNALPKGYDLLAALIRSIEHLSELKGGCQEGHIRRLLNDSAWQPTGSPFQPCQHDSHETCWNQPEFLQKITPERSNGQIRSISFHDHVNGAVVFGGPLKPRRFTISSRVSGKYQNQPDTIRIPI
ncbi:uncharacterized protein N7496_012688 [Penicillium cataractarum]|uniref:Uncharacterized protein n=1 Tax=Penicillium cataractarum TaxID=2100454 RepID=A0A9W9R8B6_9EURO|nr:uncharacterized protein N7496_012688 [Penicillium cataractarum]KAJ5355476.1 hypothetical protein N7496_012688 [Penicillium cataractarum]